MNILIADTATAGYHELVLSRNIVNSSGKTPYHTITPPPHPSKTVAPTNL